MTQRTVTSVIVVLVLLASLLTGAIVSGAQQPPSLTESFTWQPYHLSVRYPAGWVLTQGTSAISLAPPDRDVSDGYGPELVLFDQPGVSADQFGATIAAFGASAGAIVTSTEPTTIGGSSAMRATLQWLNPAALGGMLLVAAKPETAVGAAYIVRAADAPLYRDTLSAMFESITLSALSGVRGSISNASVQLPQAYTWTAAGLLLRFPADWTVATETATDGSVDIVASSALAGGVVLQGMLIARSTPIVPFNQLVETALSGWGTVLDRAAVSVAGHSGLIYDLRDSRGTAPTMLRILALDLPERASIALLGIAAEESAWPQVRPVASAFFGALEAAPATTSRSAAFPLANPQPRPAPLPRQDDPALEPYLWEDYGVTIGKPADWEVLQGGRDFDLALAAPGVVQGASGGYLIFRIFTSLGPGVTIKDALAPVAENAKASLTDYAAGGVGFRAPNGDTVEHLVLYPYGDKGSALLVQAGSPATDEALIAAMLASIVIAPPPLDVAAVDAAWQASLAADGTLSYGEAEAPVVLREYLSFTCGHCANYTLPIQALMALEVATGRARLEIAPLAGDDKTTLATAATYCAAGQGFGYSAYKALFQSYLDLGYEKAYTRQSVLEVLSAALPELDTAALSTCIDEQQYQDAINQAITGFVAFGLTGTPTMLIGQSDADIAPLALPNGQIWSGAVPLSALRTLIRFIVDDGLTPAEASTRYFGG